MKFILYFEKDGYTIYNDFLAKEWEDHFLKYYSGENKSEFETLEFHFAHSAPFTIIRTLIKEGKIEASDVQFLSGDLDFSPDKDGDCKVFPEEMYSEDIYLRRLWGFDY